MNRPCSQQEIEAAIVRQTQVGTSGLISQVLVSDERKSIIRSGNSADPNNRNFKTTYPKAQCNRDFSSLWGNPHCTNKSGTTLEGPYNTEGYRIDYASVAIF